MHCKCMPSTTITISTVAYKKLKAFKEPGDSFSDVILRELPSSTCGEVLESLDRDRESGVLPKANPRLRRAMLAGRGRRSNRG